MAAPALDVAVDEWIPHGINSVFLYTREAHPGEFLPAHRSLEQKIAQAKAFQERCGIKRPVLVDNLEGTVHKAFGMLPNMSYIVSQAGRVLFRSDWTDPSTVQAAVDYLLAARKRRKDGLRLKPFYSEFVGYRWTDDPAFQAGLAIAGQQAIDDFAEASEVWRKGTPLKGAVSIDES